MNLENVKVGDMLFTVSGKTFSTKKYLDVATVLRETKTQLILSNDRRINKQSGKQIGTGGKWTSSTYWKVYDKEEVGKIREFNFEEDVKIATEKLGYLLNKKLLTRLLDDLER